jgi:hypothetical protein
MFWLGIGIGIVIGWLSITIVCALMVSSNPTGHEILPEDWRGK